MSDSNLTPAPAAPTQSKSYTERFLEMEETMSKLIYASNFHTNTLADMMDQMQNMVTRFQILDTVRNTINAMMILSEEGKPFTIENLAQKVLQQQAKFERERIAADLERKAILPVDSIKDDNTILAFESLPEIEYGHGTLSSFKGDTHDALIGKKPGDYVGNMKILGVYELNPDYKAGDNNEQSGQEPRE